MRRSQSAVEERHIAERIVSDPVEKRKDLKTYPEAGEGMPAQEGQSKGWKGGKKINQSKGRG